MSKENPNEGLPVMNGVESLYYQEPENYVKRFGTGLINNQWGQTPLILFIINIKPTGWPSLETTLTLRFPAAGLRRYDKLDCFVNAFLAMTARLNSSLCLILFLYYLHTKHFCCLAQTLIKTSKL